MNNPSVNSSTFVCQSWYWLNGVKTCFLQHCPTNGVCGMNLPEDQQMLRGWICPRCGKVHSPLSTVCDCSASLSTYSATVKIHDIINNRQTSLKQIEAEKGKEMPTDDEILTPKQFFCKVCDVTFPHDVLTLPSYELFQWMREYADYRLKFKQSLPKEPTPELRDFQQYLKDAIKNKSFQTRFDMPCDFDQDKIDQMIDEAIDEYLNSKEK